MNGPTPRDAGFRMPAEWEPQQAVWLSWPHNPETWAAHGIADVRRVYVETIRALGPQQHINLLVNDDESERAARDTMIDGGVDFTPVTFLQIPTRDTWIRDYGPTFVVNRSSRAVAMVKWEFNAWGGKYEDLEADTRVPFAMNRGLGMQIFEAGIVLEGGSIEVNGRGTVLTTTQCLLNPNRNPHLSREQVEQYLRDYLDVSQVIWLGDGIAGDDTDGHVDDIARFVDPTTVVCVVEEDPDDENYEPLRENHERLERAVDQDGRPLRVLTLPTPGPISDATGRLPASYANFYIGNAAVVVPIFGVQADDQALGVLRECFPGRHVVGVDSRHMVAGLGAIHCCSQQQPKGEN
ncbi:MAG: agmatine/peptidylarginine deiminase [Vicinamibacterales bacterium]